MKLAVFIFAVLAREAIDRIQVEEGDEAAYLVQDILVLLAIVVFVGIALTWWSAA